MTADEPIALGLAWLGIRTNATSAMSALLTDLLGLRELVRTDSFVAFRLSNGDVVELFHPDDTAHAIFDTGPVAGFAVSNIDTAAGALHAAGVDVIGDVHIGGKGSRWLHFRGPDGNVYELLEPLTPPP